MALSRPLFRATLAIALAAQIAQQTALSFPGPTASGYQSSISSGSLRVPETEFEGAIALGPHPQWLAPPRAFEQGNQPISRPRQAAPASEWTLMPKGLIYRPYLAGAKESRIRSVWHDEKGEGGIWDITLGGQVGILRYGLPNEERPMGFQIGIEGAGLTRLDLDEKRDVMATDYRFGVPLTWGDDSYQVKFGYYHLSSHLGDEFLLKHPTYPRLNFSRDVLIWGVSFSPLQQWRVYSEAGYAFHADVTEPWEFQFGVEYAPDGATGLQGQPFAAANGHLREEVDFGGNMVLQLGWAWRRDPASGMFRMGVEYFNGKSDQFSFFDDSEQKVGFGLWYDY